MRRWALAAAALLGCCGRPIEAPGDETLTPWPFTLDTVTLSCRGGAARMVFVETDDGRTFAVNGSARSEAPLMRDIQAEVNLAPLIARGLRLCDAGTGSVRLKRPLETSEARIETAPASFVIEPSDYSDGVHATLEAQNAISGTRPRLTLGCSPGRAPMIILNLVQAPRTPPPLRGVMARFQIGAQERSIEMSWGLDATWTLRSGDARLEDAQLTQLILEAGELAFIGDRQYMPAQAIHWDLAAHPDELARVRQLCRR